jgi:hypothetical protein
MIRITTSRVIGLTITRLLSRRRRPRSPVYGVARRILRLAISASIAASRSPQVVLVTTVLSAFTRGGRFGRIVGLILAVPASVNTESAVQRFQSRNVVALAADRAQPAVERLLH